MGEFIDGMGAQDGFPAWASSAPVTKTSLAVIAIQNAHARVMAATPYQPMGGKERHDLLDMMPANFIETNQDDFLTAVFAMMHQQANTARAKIFDEVLASRPMMQGRPEDCALVIGRWFHALPHDGTRASKADYILSGTFGKKLAKEDPAAYADLVTTLADDAPQLLERRDVATFEQTPLREGTPSGFKYKHKSQATLTVAFVKPSLGLPPLLSISADSVTRTMSTASEQLKDVPGDAKAAAIRAFEGRAGVIHREYPAAAAALTQAVQELKVA